ncbi:hypothetical protein PIB30_026786 [Stylosanthes scabra]|uniref:Uncharacterized protein n=1 Tax=Stylosanthes scabra TaxID=79078 RepID=A0ABU6Y7P7_9FABA|nr:hypothetical protein [Stylosanthes scabra]
MASRKTARRNRVAMVDLDLADRRSRSSIEAPRQSSGRLAGGGDVRASRVDVEDDGSRNRGDDAFKGDGWPDRVRWLREDRSVKDGRRRWKMVVEGHGRVAIIFYTRYKDYLPGELALYDITGNVIPVEIEKGYRTAVIVKGYRKSPSCTVFPMAVGSVYISLEVAHEEINYKIQ